MKHFRWIVFAGCLLLLVGCGAHKKKPRVLQPDITFSFNVMEVPADWPIEERDWPVDPTEAAVRQGIYEKEGKPDFFRFRWRKDGEPVTRREVQEMLFVKDNRARDLKAFSKGKNLEVDWIYSDKGLVYKFEKKGVEKETLSDELKTICDLGDPQEIKQSIDPTRRAVTIYQYYDEGKVFYFTDGVLQREERQPRMEGFYQRR